MPLLFFFSGFFAEVVGTVAGFGSSTIFLPLALFFFDFPTALVLVAFFHLFGNIGRIGFFRYGLEKDLLLKFGVPGILFSFAGALIVPYLPQDTLKAALGIFLIAYSAIFFSGKNISARPSPANLALGGGLSGFLAGLIGTGGALRGAFLSAFNLSKEKYIATAAFAALLVDATRIPVYLSQGFLESTLLPYLPALFLTAIAGTFVGKKIIARVPQEKFRVVVLTAVFLAGLKFVYDFLA